MLPVSSAPNPQSLSAAREQRKLSIDEVAEFTGISIGRIEAFETGSREPSLRQVEQLASLYNVPVYLLYLDATPKLEIIIPDFRRQNPQPADLSPRGLVRIWAVEKISTFTRQLQFQLTDALPPLRQITKPNRLSTAYANRLRSEFDDWFGQRESAFGLSGPTESRTLTGLRLYFETFGALSFVNDAPAKDYMGFYAEPQGGLRSIFVNRKISSKKAQLFTFVHEFAHWLTGQEGVSDPFKTSNDVERRCNRFAAEFLAPSDRFVELAKSYYRSNDSDYARLIRIVSHNSLLSNQATAVRLLEHEFISRSDYAAWNTLWAKNPAKEKEDEKEGQSAGGPGAFAKRVGELGYHAVYISSLAIQHRIVDSVDVARGLGLAETIQEKAFSLATRRFEAASE